VQKEEDEPLNEFICEPKEMRSTLNESMKKI
jgi:hypothetical protein